MVSNGNYIFWRTSTNSSVLALVDKDIELLLSQQQTTTPGKFNTTAAIIITFDDLLAYRSTTNRFKYQLVIATNYKQTFAIINYHRLDLSGSIVGFYDRSLCGPNKTLRTAGHVPLNPDLF